MKTIGEILKSARLEKNLTHEQLSSATKIDERYIKALEENNFKVLPSSTFTKGFVRNLSLALGKSPDDWLALLRRDYQSSHVTIKDGSFRRTRRFSLSSLIQSQAFLITTGVLIFLTYLGFQYRAVITPPPLSVTSPMEDAVLISPVTVEGKTTSGTTVTINDDLKLTPDQQGVFQTKLNLSQGEHEISITVTNRFGRSSTKIIPLTIVSP